MPIQITITVETAAEAVQLVQDLASTMSGMNPSDIPAKTEVSTVEQPVQAVPAPAVPVQAAVPDPTAQAPAALATTAVPTAQPVPTAAPTAPTTPTPVQAPAPTAVPTATQTYTLDQLAVAATQLVDAGRREELVQLLSQFGVQALTALPKEQYGAFATALRQMGAKI